MVGKPFAVLSTLPDNPGHSSFWTVSPGLQIRVWNLLDIKLYTQLSDNKLLNILGCLSYFTVNIKRFLVNFCVVYFAIAMYAIERSWFWFWFYYALWLVSVFTLVLVLRQSSENHSNIANSWWSGQLLFFAQMTSCTMWYDVPMNSQCFRTWGVDSPAFVIRFC